MQKGLYENLFYAFDQIHQRGADLVNLVGCLDNDILAVKTCVKCHKEDGWVARGLLQRQNAMTIQFMVSSGFMPPPGFSLLKQEHRAIDDFIRGF